MALLWCWRIPMHPTNFLHMYSLLLHTSVKFSHLCARTWQLRNKEWDLHQAGYISDRGDCTRGRLGWDAVEQDSSYESKPTRDPSQTPVWLQWALSQPCYNWSRQGSFLANGRMSFMHCAKDCFFFLTWIRACPGNNGMGYSPAERIRWAGRVWGLQSRANESAYLHFSGMRLSFRRDTAGNLKLLNVLLHCHSPKVLLQS